MCKDWIKYKKSIILIEKLSDNVFIHTRQYKGVGTSCL